MIALSLLIALVLYVLLAWVAVRMVGWLARICVFTTVTRRAWQALCLAFFVLVPTWDIIPGQLYFQHLCDVEAGVKVFRMVEVDQSYFRPDGRPDDKKLAERYVQTSKFDRKFSTIFNIARTETTVFDNQTNEVLAVGSNFSNRGGWLTQFVLPDASGTSCPAYPYFGMHGITLQQAFRPRAEPHH